MRNAARTMADLHAVDPSAIGLADEPLVGPWPTRSTGGVTCSRRSTRRCARLAAGGERARVRAIPPTETAAVVHGDFRLGNLLAVGPDVTSIIDWEIWTVGDPRVDLGWFLANADPSTYKRPTAVLGALPSPDELLGVYADALGRDVPDVEWFQALACFKSTATWSLIVKHNRRRAEPDAEVEAMVATLPDLLDRATRLPAVTRQRRDPREPVGDLGFGLGLEAEEVLGREQVGRRLVVLQQLPGERDLVHLGGAVGEAEHERLDEVLHERHLVGDAERAVHLERARRHVVQHLLHHRLDRGDVGRAPPCSRCTGRSSTRSAA